MRDPLEGVSAGGMITTGAHRSRIADHWRPLLDDVCNEVRACRPDTPVYLYGSVATGRAELGRSDVDLLTIDLPPEAARRISTELSDRHASTCRGVEIGAATAADFLGEHDEAYGNRVFLRHYCVHVTGPAAHTPEHDFPADARAARGFNGDIARHRDRWREALDHGDDPRSLARRIARKTLLAVGGLVSVHDATWTTDRTLAAHRWAEIEPARADGLRTLLGWVDPVPSVDATDVGTVLGGVVDPLVERFSTDIGLWT